MLYIYIYIDIFYNGRLIELRRLIMVVEEEEEGRECKSQKRVAKEDTRSALVIGV